MNKIPPAVLAAIALSDRELPEAIDVAENRVTPSIRRDPHQRSHGNKGRTSGAPTCPACRVTLSHGECLNRMCDNFNKVL